MLVTIHIAALMLALSGVAVLSLLLIPVIVALVTAMVVVGTAMRLSAWAKRRPIDALLTGCALAVTVTLLLLAPNGIGGAR